MICRTTGRLREMLRMAGRAQLTEQQRDHYYREGYVVVERFFGAGILADVDATVRQLTKN